MKRIAIFLDGTTNQLENNTNVWRLKSLCDPLVKDQIVYYCKGVGTAFGEFIRGRVGGYGIDTEILQAYAWLAQSFEPGDEIFLFGFSRGAYTARSLSGLIAKCGVLKPGAPLSLEQLYARYRRHSDRTIHELMVGTPPRDLEERWIVKYCEPTNIKMVGVWDTVGSLGSPFAATAKKVTNYMFLDTHLRVQNEFAFHALAIDEQRKSFEPTLWTRTTDNSASASPVARPLAQVEQRWFVGAHANVGGGYPSDVLAQPPLEWLMNKAATLGLQFRNTFVADGQDPTSPIIDSYHDFGYGLVRLIVPRFNRAIGSEPVKGSAKSTERINETIDGSVFDRWRGNSAYRPAAIQSWATLRDVKPEALVGTRLARDPSVTVP